MRRGLATLLGLTVMGVSLYHIRSGKDFAHEYPQGSTEWWTHTYEITWLIPLACLALVYLACIPPKHHLAVGVPTALYLLYGASVAQFAPHAWLNWEDLLNGGGAVLGMLWVIGALW